MENQPRILVIDDEAHIVHVVSLKLRNAGYQVLSAADGEEGLALAHARRPDLIITDYQMPYLTGLDLAERLHADPPTRDIPVLMLTAHGQMLCADRIARAGIEAVISKPFSPRDILARAQQMIRRRDPAGETA